MRTKKQSKGLGIRDWGLGIRNEGRGERGEGPAFRLPPSAFPLPPSANPQSLIPNPSRGFTLVELLVTITIIGILAGMVLGALQMARQSAREAATKATIVKLNAIIMQRYESYMTRRVPIQITDASGNPWDPVTAARMRLYALRTLMQLEMPDSAADIPATTPIMLPAPFAYRSVPEPALYRVYSANTPTGNYDSAKCLYLIVSRGSPEAMEQFNQSEIGSVDGQPIFIDAWGTPICWLRWAPGFVRPASDIQTGNPAADSDPFDPRKLVYDESTSPKKGFHLIPLICSAGPDKQFGLNDLQNQPSAVRATILTSDNPYAIAVGGPITSGAGSNTHHDNIHNHHIEQR